jgi:hypothetical protein
MKAFFFILLISNLSSALCQKNLKVLYFANGMFNSRREAKASLNELRKAYELKSNKENFNEYQVAYNTDEPALLQLFEVYRQKSEEYGLGFWKWIKSFKGAENNKEIEKLLQEFYSEQRSVDVDLRIQIKDYNKYLKKWISNHHCGTFARKFLY